MTSADRAVLCLDDAHLGDASIYNGDCHEILRQLPDDSIGHSVYSPPFGDLFVYSDSVADMGNSGSDGEFFSHYDFMARELLRVLKPGRIAAVHCSDLPTRKWKDGYIGLKPFSDQIREAHERAGFIFYRRVTIWKCPVVEQGRTHSRNLLYGELCKDSSMSAPGLPDYLMIFRKPGDNPQPIRHTPEQFPLSQWQEWASPVWMTVDQTKVLGGVVAQRQARDHADERHVCPLQLDVIRRSIIMWSNPGDTVISPFMGIGSEGVVALEEGRRFVGVELKRSYFEQAKRHLAAISNQMQLFGGK
ncbi:MAG: site-specific DNA-methyltransferase [Vampirovibrionales bacterium]|nr:site-specific DNA-methyltransferase [Vampirovibrionales bacterium]